MYVKEILFQSKIADSEAYRKYLFHKDISEHKAKAREIDASLSVTEIEIRLADSRYEENKISQVETLCNWKDIPKAHLNIELEEIKRKYEEDIAEIQSEMNYLSRNKIETQIKFIIKES